MLPYTLRSLYCRLTNAIPAVNNYPLFRMAFSSTSLGTTSDVIQTDVTTTPKNRGRPRNPDTPSDVKAIPRKRGRPPKSDNINIVKVWKRTPRNMQKPPKKPPSAYLLFMNDFWNDRPRAQSIDESRQLMSEGAKLWKTLSADRVAEYQEKANASMKIWREQRTEYARSLPLADFLILNKVRGHQKKRLYRFNDVPQDERPKGKKYNKYSEFVRREFTDLDLPPGMTACDYISKVLMVKWRSLSPSEKESYKVNSLH